MRDAGKLFGEFFAQRFEIGGDYCVVGKANPPHEGHIREREAVDRASAREFLFKGLAGGEGVEGRVGVAGKNLRLHAEIVIEDTVGHRHHFDGDDVLFPNVLPLVIFGQDELSRTGRILFRKGIACDQKVGTAIQEDSPAVGIACELLLSGQGRKNG